MEWLKMTGPAFRKYLASGSAVAVLPTGSIEKHGEHLPMGTDTLNVEFVAREASKRAGAVMLPALAYTLVHEMKASAGAVSLRAKTFLAVLEEICDDVARNGVKKIVLVNGHGGNNYILMTFIQDLPGKGKDYAVYHVNVGSCISSENREKIEALSKTTVPGGHADDVETDATLSTYPDLVDLDAISQDPQAGVSRLDFDIKPARAQTWWYAEYPDSLAGDPRFPSHERGKLIVTAAVEGLTDLLIRIRDDKKVAERNAAFEAEARDPKKMR